MRYVSCTYRDKYTNFCTFFPSVFVRSLSLHVPTHTFACTSTIQSFGHTSALCLLFSVFIMTQVLAKDFKGAKEQIVKLRWTLLSAIEGRCKSLTYTFSSPFVCVFECVIAWPVSQTLVSSFCHLPLPPYWHAHMHIHRHARSEPSYNHTITVITKPLFFLPSSLPFSSCLFSSLLFPSLLH